MFMFQIRRRVNVSYKVVHSQHGGKIYDIAVGRFHSLASANVSSNAPVSAVRAAIGCVAAVAFEHTIWCLVGEKEIIPF